LIDSPNLSRFLISGDSLFPSVPRRAIATVRTANRRTLRPGAIAIFTAYHRHVCHRVLWHRRQNGLDWFYFSGNFRTGPDGWIPAYRIVGEVTEINAKSLITPVARLTGTLWALASAVRILIRFGSYR